MKRFFSLRGSEKLLLAEVLFFLSFSKLVMYLVPFKRLTAHLGTLNGSVRQQLTDQESDRANRLRYFLFMVSANVPWQSVCLDQALAANFMLNRRHLPNELLLGVKIDKEQKKLNAHAWIKCNNKIFIGGRQSNEYKIVATYAKKDQR